LYWADKEVIKFCDENTKNPLDPPLAADALFALDWHFTKDGKRIE